MFNILKLFNKQKPTKVKKCWVDKCECMDHLLCLTEAPTIMKMDNDDKHPNFKCLDIDTLNNHIYEVQGALDVCPIDAIRAEFDNGKIHKGGMKKIEDYLPKNNNS